MAWPDELINALTRIRGLRVISRTSSFQFKGASADVREIGKRLDVRAVLEGSVRKSGERLRVTAQVTDVASGFRCRPSSTIVQSPTSWRFRQISPSA